MASSTGDTRPQTRGITTTISRQEIWSNWMSFQTIPTTPITLIPTICMTCQGFTGKKGGTPLQRRVGAVKGKTGKTDKTGKIRRLRTRKLCLFRLSMGIICFLTRLIRTIWIRKRTTSRRFKEGYRSIEPVLSSQKLTARSYLLIIWNRPTLYPSPSKGSQLVALLQSSLKPTPKTQRPQE
jgi:hypothetical protein